MLTLLVFLLVVGIVMAFLPVDANVRRLIYYVLAALVVLWLIGVLFGGFEVGGWYPRRRIVVD